MLIDTHCHLDASEFDADRDAVIQAAIEQGVQMMVIPAVEKNNFAQVIQLAEKYGQCAYALGIHPMYVKNAQPEDLSTLKTTLEKQIKSDLPPVAIGEIGLDYFVEDHDKALQSFYFTEQLKLAKQFDLPVILHVRRAIDDILKYLRLYKVRGGIAHAFNGSQQQAEQFIELGFKLGFGGAMTYPRALKIRGLASSLSMEAIVLETDAPDIPPEWLKSGEKNSPSQLKKISEIMAELRSIKASQVAEITTKNALEILPNMAKLFTRHNVLL
jgi:TatD DNase family protein